MIGSIYAKSPYGAMANNGLLPKIETTQKFEETSRSLKTSTGR